MAKLINKNVNHICDDKEGYMSLYACGDKKINPETRKPIIFIRGHAGKYTVNTKKILDNAPQNEKLIKQHEGFYYDDNIHYPFIAEYSYKDNMEKHIYEYKKEEITTQRFALSIMEIVEKLNLFNVDMVGASVGANISMLCSKSDRIDRVSVVSPTMPYSYLADTDTLIKFKNKSLFDRIMYHIAKIYLDQNYGFVADMNKTFRDPTIVKNLIDPKKIFIQAGDVKHTKSKNIINMIKEVGIILSAKKITKATGLPADGAVVTDTNFYNELGVQYEVRDDDFHVFCDQAEYILKKAYNDLDKINKKR